MSVVNTSHNMSDHATSLAVAYPYSYMRFLFKTSVGCKVSIDTVLGNVALIGQ